MQSSNLFEATAPGKIKNCVWTICCDCDMCATYASELTFLVYLGLFEEEKAWKKLTKKRLRGIWSSLLQNSGFSTQWEFLGELRSQFTLHSISKMYRAKSMRESFRKIPFSHKLILYHSEACLQIIICQLAEWKSNNEKFWIDSLVRYQIKWRGCSEGKIQLTFCTY